MDAPIIGSINGGSLFRAGLYCGANRWKELLWLFGCQILARPLSLSFLFLFTLTKVESSTAGKLCGRRPEGKRRGGSHAFPSRPPPGPPLACAGGGASLKGPLRLPLPVLLILRLANATLN